MSRKVPHRSSALNVNKGISQPPQVDSEAAERFKRTLPADLRAEDYIQGIRGGDRVALGKAITLAESTLPKHRSLAQEVIDGCLPFAGNSVRIGVTGVPGVGKSTFLETIGKSLTAKGHRLAVLAIDPSSQRTRGSILGDKTRMEELANDPNAFIRPSASAGSLGGVARKTRETITLCEAAGFDVLFVETVGVGQSETAVHSMVDFFLLLMLAGAGDELQGIKRGIMEMADAIVINKADGDNSEKAEMARQEYENALHLFPPALSGWTPRVLTCSAVTGKGIPETWGMISEYFDMARSSGYFDQRRTTQSVQTFQHAIEESLKEDFFHHTRVRPLYEEYRNEILAGKMSPYNAAQELLRIYLGKK